MSERRVEVLRYEEGKSWVQEDEIASEEPLKLTVVHGETSRSIYIMRTPGDDDFLVLGFLFTQGAIRGIDDIELMQLHDNSVKVKVRSPFQLRDTMVNSSCGVCGSSSIPFVQFRQDETLKVRSSVLMDLPRKMRSFQRTFLETGGMHASCVFDVNGNPLFIAEDVGRHNAVDKVIGKLLKAGKDAHDLILQVSGRVGYEIIQKAAMIGFPVVSAISAPTSSAVELSHIAGISLVGFVREGRLNVYSHPERIVFDLN
ncbi:formate dehydrogenase accessory sulfurtransferase FdhD [Sulfuracidifex tepidarius]|uniref:Sulfur carrier protein FdhD n=1 Tax=Sulfuracidifex tepidarius TaxID=1294262 RepID=A0A510E0Z6_9CREN|nr:formate dehydrogenase accessory sulfurtransferase FdhD [Sulfuracidifex tepidarius]BBG26164.1 Protein FdhD [Sulfuracidifex tepidarius]